MIGDTLIVYGGDDGKQFMSDVWALPLLPLNPNSSLATSTSAVDGSKLPGWVQPTVSSGASGALPSGRRGHVTVAAHKGNVIVMQGGRMKHHVCLQDTWLLSPKDGATGPDAWSGPLEWSVSISTAPRHPSTPLNPLSPLNPANPPSPQDRGGAASRLMPLGPRSVRCGRPSGGQRSHRHLRRATGTVVDYMYSSSGARCGSWVACCMVLYGAVCRVVHVPTTPHHSLPISH